MSPEHDEYEVITDWDDLIAGDRKAPVYQESFYPQWVFPFDGKYTYRFARSTISIPNEKIKRFQTNITNMEVILPYLLEKEELISLSDAVQKPGANKQWKAALTGTVLHELDQLYHAIRLDLVGPYISNILPTTDQTDIERFQKYTDGLYGYGLPQHELRDLFSEVIRRRRNDQKLVEDGTASLFPDIIGRNPFQERSWVYGDDLLEIEHRLADFWADEVYQPRRLSWEFINAPAVREATFVLNLNDFPLQFIGRLDSISGQRVGSGPYQTWIVDLKTGKKPEYEELSLEREILQRQMQVSVLIAERFTAKFAQSNRAWVSPGMRAKSSMVQRPGAFIIGTNARNNSFIDRLYRSSFRYFDQETGTCDMVHITIDDKDREEFFTWLDWYATGIQTHKLEIKKLLKQGVQYDLRRARLL